MKLNKILENCSSKFTRNNDKNVNIEGISTNSTEMKNNYIFGAIKGKNFNGENFINSFSKYKDVVIVISKRSNVDKDIKNKFNIIIVSNVRSFISDIANIVYKNQIDEIIAVTGTNGKTSVADYTRQIWEQNKLKASSIGTLGIIYNDQKINSFLTTPQSIDLQKALSKLSENGCKKVVVEASSIGIDQNRLFPLKFDKIAFTNFSRDHLDYHESMTKYLNSKLKLFKKHSKEGTIAILNSDDPKTKTFAEICSKKKIKILDYGENASFLRIISIKKKNNRYFVTIKLKDSRYLLKLNFNSSFEIYNLFCAMLLVFGEKLEYNSFGTLDKLVSPKGRLEKIYDKEFKIFIDYAHTPDALKNVLLTLNSIKKNRIISIIGCGGGRDKGKRILLTKEAIKYSDLVILADDNPRNEKPEEIRNDMVKGLSKLEKRKINNIGDRKKAIEFGINIIKKNDILLIAGKGHEDYQEIKNKRVFFSDHKIINETLR